METENHQSRASDTREGKPRVTVGDARPKLESGIVRSETGGGWTASEVLTVDNGLPEGEKGDIHVVTPLEAVREDRAASGAKTPNHSPNVPLTALGQPFAIYRHPSEFTEQEDAVIINGLLAQLPIYMIADKLKCSRNLLQTHIRESKLLSQVMDDRKESFIDNIEWQAKRLIDSGNPAMIMFALEHLGKERGWGPKEVADEDFEDTRIVIGEIPDAEVAAADAKVKELEAAVGVGGGGGEGGTGDSPSPAAATATPVATQPAIGSPSPQKLPSPMEMALMEDAAKRAAEEVRRERDANTINIPQEDVQVEPAPWDDGYAGGDPFDGGGFEGFM